MSKVRFYRQARSDGGVRTGIGIDDQPVLHEFRPGSDESDPALLWYVDLALEGKGLPLEAEEARAWLLECADPITTSLRTAARRLEIGLDDSVEWPYRIQLTGLPRGIRSEIRISGVRGLAEGELASHLIELAETWQAVLEQLAPMVPA